MDSRTTLEAIQLVMSERLRQERKWGEQNKAPERYLMILMEEIGEWSQEVLDSDHAGGNQERRERHLRNAETELVQVAAVALAIVECSLRNNWRNNGFESCSDPIVPALPAPRVDPTQSERETPVNSGEHAGEVLHASSGLAGNDGERANSAEGTPVDAVDYPG